MRKDRELRDPSLEIVKGYAVPMLVDGVRNPLKVPDQFLRLIEPLQSVRTLLTYIADHGGDVVQLVGNRDERAGLIGLR